jgi:F-type H+-transporting ATPase subunit b
MPPRKLAALLLILVPLFLGAASAEENHRSPLADYLGKTVNFILLFGGLGFLLAKPLRAFLEARASGLKAAMEEAEASRKEAEARLAAIRRRLDGLDQEVDQVKKGGELEGRREMERILEQARREAEKLTAFAGQEIRHQGQEAVRELRAYAAGLAVSLAGTRIEDRLTPEVHSRLIDESIGDIGKLHEKSYSG